jgi:hypothetical protein
VSEQHTIEVPKIFEPIAQAIVRISVFVGFGTNAANDPDLHEYRLPGPDQMRFVRDLTEEEIRTRKNDFGKWILKNGLRELVEAYEITLDEVYTQCVRLYSIVGKNFDHKGKPFDRLHLYKKLVTLVDYFGIATQTEDELQSLMQARHCMSHRLGLVAREDCNRDGSFVLNFRRLRVFVRQPSGEEMDLRDVITNKVVVKEGGHIMVQLQKIEKSFPIGSAISLSPEEVQDVLWTFYQSASILREKFEAFLRSEAEAHNWTVTS